MEITIVSAEGLKNTHSFFSQPLRPYITLTTIPWEPRSIDEKCHVYNTRVDEVGGANPTWNDKFHVPLECTFSSNRYIFLQVYTKRLIASPTQLGWCHVPISDILDGLSPAGLTRRLSYRLRGRDGSRGHGVVNLAVKLEGLQPINVSTQRTIGVDLHEPVIGIPVSMLPPNSAFSHSFGLSSR